MRITNKRIFITRIVEILLIIATVVLTVISIKYANTMRGHSAVGGEYFIPVLPALIIIVLEDRLENC